MSDPKESKRLGKRIAASMEAEVILTNMTLGRQQDMMQKQNFSAGASLSEEDFNHLLELVRKRKLEEIGGNSDDKGN